MLALYERTTSGKGQVVDAAMVDGAAFLASVLVLSSQLGFHRNDLDGVGTNLLDSGAHFYDTYICKDGKHFSVGAIEPQFYKILLECLGLDHTKDGLSKQMDKENWPRMKAIFQKRFLEKDQAEWTRIFEGKDACSFPILSIEDAMNLEHNVARKTFLPSAQFPGFNEVNAAPKLSRTGALPFRKFPTPGGNTEEILKSLGYSSTEVKELYERKGALQAKL